MHKQNNLFIRSARRGLTLIEIMVVIALLGVLGTVIAVNLTDALDDNSADAAKLQMKQIGSGLQMYALKNKFVLSFDYAIRRAPIGRRRWVSIF